MLLWPYIKNNYNKNPTFTVFVTVSLVSIIVVIIAGILTFGESFKDMFLLRYSHPWGDFIESSRCDFNYRKDIYPALCLIFTYFFGITISALNTIGLDGIKITYLLFFSVCTFMMYYLIYNKMNDNKNKKIIVLIVLTLSLPYMFLFERGNILFLASPLLIYYIFNYNSEKQNSRLLSYVSLAICVGIKPYLLPLSLLVIKRKSLKEIGYLFIIGVTIFFVPFILIGPDSFMTWINNITHYVPSVGTGPHGDYINFHNTMMIILSSIGVEYTASYLSTISWILLVPAAIITFFIIIDEEWKLVSLVITMTLLFTSFKPIYTIVFLIAPLVLFLNNNHISTKINVVYTFLFLLLFIPMLELFIPIAPGVKIPSSTIIEAFALLTLFVLMLGEMIIHNKKGLRS